MEVPAVSPAAVAPGSSLVVAGYAEIANRRKHVPFSHIGPDSRAKGSLRVRAPALVETRCPASGHAVTSRGKGHSGLDDTGGVIQYFLTG